MILGIDTDVLVNWAMAGAPHHRAARRLIETEVRERKSRLGITPQVLFEFVHVSTDPRRFENPLPMDRAIDLTRTIWDAEETVRLVPGPTVVHRALDLIAGLRLGRKRILDTVLAATLEGARVRRLATLNERDFEGFAFLEIVPIH